MFIRNTYMKSYMTYQFTTIPLTLQPNCIELCSIFMKVLMLSLNLNGDECIWNVIFKVRKVKYVIYIWT